MGVGLTSLILKGGDEDDPNNYRAITVTDTITKILAIMIDNRLDDWVSKNKIICQEQIGFQRKCRPADHIFVLKTLMNTHLSKGEKLYSCFIDFKKAYDNVWRNGLYYKLIISGTDLDLVRIIRSMYEQTKQALLLNGKLTRPFRTYKGVKQGCILSPRLFNLFINDIPTIFDETCTPLQLGNEIISCLMYADDLVLLSTTKNGLQQSLNKLEDYTNKWGIDLNIRKTKIMIFQRGGKREKSQFMFGKNTIEQTKEYKYLGTIMTDTGNFRNNEIYIKKKGLRAAFLLSRSIGNISKPSSSLIIYNKIIEPILLYNCEITHAYIPNSWDLNRFQHKMWDISKETERVTMSYLRGILGTHKKTSNISLQSETGKLPINIKIFSRIIKYWQRLLTSENKFLKESLKLEIKNLSFNKPSWMKIVIFLLKTTEVEKLPWYNDTLTHKNHKYFNEKLKICFLKWWSNYESRKQDGSKLDFYFKQKKNFKFEPYLDNVPKSTRIYTTRLRTSSHNFPIETLRYKKIPREERLFKICLKREVGDEEHYLMNCNNRYMKEERETFLNKVKASNTQFSKLTNEKIIEYNIKMHDTNTQLITAQYIQNISTIFNELKRIPPLFTLCQETIDKH